MVTPLKRERHRMSETSSSGFPPTSMDEEEMENYNYVPIANPSVWFPKLLSFQAGIIYNCLMTLLSPLFSLLSQVSESFHQAEEAKESVELVVHAAAKVPSRVAYGSRILLRKIGLGFLGAVYVCMVVTMVMVLAMILGVGLVHLWVEEPVFLRERLQFDYTLAHPQAIFSFGRGDSEGYHRYKKKMGVPVGHTFYVSLVLLLPESDYNIEIGVFQVSAELISTNGDGIAKSSQPCMLRFRSLPIRLVRTVLVMGIPLLLGLTDETQQMSIPMLKHKERYPRTEAIRISLIPRSGTSFIPQLYEAEVVINSQPPWTKEFVRRWKWTFCVWTSICIYIIMLLVILVCCFKTFIFPMTTRSPSERRDQDYSAELEVSKEPQDQRAREEREVSESLRRWQRSRSKRKAMLLHDTIVGSSASSIISITTREETTTTAPEEDDAGDSESVCFGGLSLHP